MGNRFLNRGSRSILLHLFILVHFQFRSCPPDPGCLRTLLRRMGIIREVPVDERRDRRDPVDGRDTVEDGRLTVPVPDCKSYRTR